MQNSKELTMNIGSLYRVKERYWFLFPSKESVSTDAAGALPRRSRGGVAAPAAVAASFSKEFKENVTYFSPDSYIVLLEEDGKFKKVLTSEGLIGWIWFTDRFNDSFEKVKSQ